MKRYFAILSLILLFTGLFHLGQVLRAKDAINFHTSDERHLFYHLMRTLPDAANTLFTGSGACVDCHGSDPEGIASVIGEGIDINVVDDWRATMMANSARDPFWRAKVRHEVLVNPQLQEEIETTCTSCHAPLGHFEAMYLGHEHYSIEQMVNDSLALDGVSCLACHQMSAQGLGDFFSGQLFYDTNQVAYGPYISPLSSPMIDATGYTPVFSTHINDAGLCAGCHTLITQTVDLSGEVTDNHFVEQATYHEWLNSIYNDDVSCQSCHVPRIDDEVQIIAGFFTEPRSPFGLHYFVGGNTYMLELMRDHRIELGIDATIAQFDSVLARTTRLLQQETLELEFELVSRDADTAFFELKLQNLAGHKFPSGYPSRLAFLQFLVTSDQEDTLFVSGMLDENFRIIGRNEPYEPHYNVIRQPDEVQIYEMVMVDIEGDVTTVLERAFSTVKDNRLPPIGFTDFHEVYDTTRIEGLAESDVNFNRENGIQGTGRDIIYYHVPLDGFAGTIVAQVFVYYQSVPPRWLDEMFSFSSPEIDYFAQLYSGKSPEPIQIAHAIVQDGPTSVLQNVSHNSLEFFAWGDRWIYRSEGERVTQIRAYSSTGQLIRQWHPNQTEGIIEPQLSSGLYIVEIMTANHRFVRKVLH